MALGLKAGQRLVAATHNDHLVQLVAAFGPALQAGLREATRRGWEWPDFLEYSIGPHREVLDAVMAHDPARAGEAMDRLVSQSQASFEYPAGPEARRPGGSAVGDPGPDGG